MILISSVSAHKNFIVQNEKKKHEKALNILLSAIPDRHPSHKTKAVLLKQSYAETAHIPRIYQAISSKAPTGSICASHTDEIICSLLCSTKASMPQLMMMKTCWSSIMLFG
ncbi:hypothetical protein Tco_1383488 [Tanacetum coccineum]